MTRTGSAPKRSVKVFDKAFWAHVRSLVHRRKQMWTDEWWRIGRVARYHNVAHGIVNNAIRKDSLKAVDYGNWWILKSVATDPDVQFMTSKVLKVNDKTVNVQVGNIRWKVQADLITKVPAA